MARGGFFGAAAALAVVLFYPGTLQWRTMRQKNDKGANTKGDGPAGMETTLLLWCFSSGRLSPAPSNSNSELLTLNSYPLAH